MKGLLEVFLIGAMLLLLTSVAARAQHSSIDVTSDTDQDGIPDALAQAVQEIEMSQDKQAAIADMVSRLPYAPQTRALQKQAERLQTQLADVRDKQEADKIINELRALSEQMLADPNYARTIKALTALFVPASQESGPAASVRWSALERSHLMLVRSGWLPWTAFVYAMWYSHAGTYDGSYWVYESNQDGVRLKPLSQWQQPNMYIGLGYNNKRSNTQTQSALDWAKRKYDTNGRTPYNYFFPDKWTDGRQYCSQLAWKIHTHTGVNIDSNHWAYQTWVSARWGAWAAVVIAIPAVAPDEIWLDSDVTIYSASWN